MKSIYLNKMLVPATAAFFVFSMQPARAEAPDGAALAETCATCHGTDTNRREGFDNLRGEGKLADLMEMKRRNPPRNVMDLVARTYTDQQLQAISNYLASH